MRELQRFREAEDDWSMHHLTGRCCSKRLYGCGVAGFLDLF
jgi:hypothetical protein